MLRGVHCQLVTDVSGQYIDCLALENGRDVSHQNIDIKNYQRRPRKIPEERRPQLHSGKSLKSGIFVISNDDEIVFYHQTETELRVLVGRGRPREVCLKYTKSTERFFMDRTVPELLCYVLASNHFLPILKVYVF